MKIFDELDLDFKALGFSQKEMGDIVLGTLDIKKDNKNFEKGKYRIISCHNLYLHQSYQNEVKSQIKKVLREFLTFHHIKKQSTILVCGLGNEDIISDSLGIASCKKILATRNLNFSYKKHNVCSICPNVQAVTGIETPLIVRGIVREIRADMVVIIDSLLTQNLKRLGHSFQLSSVGMIPGGAMGEIMDISQKSIGVPCISIGVPLLLDLNKLSKLNKSVVVAPKDIKHYVSVCSTIISDAINSVMCTSLSPKQISETLSPI